MDIDENLIFGEIYQLHIYTNVPPPSLQNALWWQMDLINNAALYCVSWESQSSGAWPAVARWSLSNPPPVRCVES